MEKLQLALIHLTMDAVNLRVRNLKGRELLRRAISHFTSLMFIRTPNYFQSQNSQNASFNGLSAYNYKILYSFFTFVIILKTLFCGNENVTEQKVNKSNETKWRICRYLVITNLFILCFSLFLIPFDRNNFLCY